MLSNSPAWMRVAVAVLVLYAGQRLAPAGSLAAESAAGPLSAEDHWSGLFQRQPYPYLIPLPEPRPSALDGTYAKVVTAAAERVHCRRCPDYAPEGGAWKLNLDRGVFRILHEETRWKSIATGIVAGDRILLANDPVCIDALGLYRWRLTEGELVFEVIDDPCAIRLRAMNLTGQPWRSCRPANLEAAAAGAAGPGAGGCP